MNGHVKPDEIRMMRRMLEMERDFRGGSVVEQDCLSEAEWAELSSRWAYVLDKWTRKGWWEYGVSLRTGWLTDAGYEALPRMIAETERRYKLLDEQLLVGVIRKHV